MTQSVTLVALALLLAGCSPGMTRLTPDEEKKFDPALRALLAGETVREADYDLLPGTGSEKEYAVIVRADDFNDVRKGGYTVMSAFGEAGVVRVTLAQMRRLAAMPGVRSITNGSKNQPQ
jgi:hypothetical protein